MVGIVVVSHSDKIAKGIVELCSQMANADLKIEAAGGTEDGRIGTDTFKIMEAIKKSDDGDGVLVFVDIGSAVISTELALDLLEENIRERVLIADAPIVEGCVNAVVQASVGSSLEKVMSVAKQSKDIVKVSKR